MVGKELKDYFRVQRAEMSEAHRARFPQAISWIIRAGEQGYHRDLHFIRYWLAFHTLYSAEDHSGNLTVRDFFENFITQLVRLDANKKSIIVCGGIMTSLEHQQFVETSR